MKISRLLQPFLMIYKEYNFLFCTYICKFLIQVTKLHVPKIDKTMFQLL